MSWSGFVAAFKVDIAAVLTTTPIFTFPTEPGQEGNEGISFLDLDGEHTFHAMGHTYEDTFDLKVRMWTRQPDTTSASGEPGRTRMMAMFDAIQGVLESPASTIYTGNHVARAQVTKYSVVPRKEGDSGWRIEAELSVGGLVL